MIEQKVKRCFYPNCDYDILEMKQTGYIIKQIAGSSNDNYIWILFDKVIDDINTI